MSLSRPVSVLVTGVLGAGLVLSSAGAATAAPSKAKSPAVTKAAAAKAKAKPAVAAKAKAAAVKLDAAQEKRLAPLRKQVLGSVSKVEAALGKAKLDTERTAALTPAHRTALVTAATTIRAELSRLRTATGAATTAAQLLTLQRQVPVTAVVVLDATTRAAARADEAVAASVAADTALAAALDEAVAAGKDVSDLQAEVDAARAAATTARETLVPVVDALVAAAGTPAARSTAAHAQARVSALTGAVRGRTGDLRELVEQVEELEAPVTEPPATEPTPEPAPDTEPTPDNEPAPAP